MKIISFFMTQNACYYTDNKDSCPDNVRFHGIEKYPKKILVHVTISDRGISKALILPSGSLSVNSAIYIKECLEKRVLPFIEEFHIDGNYILWPDFANAYYFNETQAWLRGKIPKHLNLPNVPQARPIENFWGCLTQKVCEGGWEAITEQQLLIAFIAS